MPWLQRERCVPGDSQPHAIGTRALSCRRGVNSGAFGAMPWRQRERCVPAYSMHATVRCRDETLRSGRGAFLTLNCALIPLPFCQRCHMPKLLFKTPSPTDGLTLKEGLNRVGRDPANDLCLTDPSVSGFHCELHVLPREIRVRDLNSANGTFVDREAVTEAELRPGQELRLGAVEMILEVPPIVAIPDLPKPVIKEQLYFPDGTPACLHHSDRPAVWHCSKCQFCICDDCVRFLKMAGRAEGLRFCKECGGRCQPIEPLEAAPSRGSKVLAQLRKWFGGRPAASSARRAGRANQSRIGRRR